jgi:hypothetical protein
VTDIRTRRAARLGHDHRTSAQLHARGRSEMVGPWDACPQGTIGVVASCFEAAMLTEDRTARTRVVVRANQAPVSEVHLVVHDTSILTVPKSELNDELENAVLTWEEKDSSAVHAC